jgi:hypothetical protein
VSRRPAILGTQGRGTLNLETPARCNVASLGPGFLNRRFRVPGPWKPSLQPGSVRTWSLTTLREKLIKIGAKGEARRGLGHRVQPHLGNTGSEPRANRRISLDMGTRMRSHADAAK